MGKIHILSRQHLNYCNKPQDHYGMPKEKLTSMLLDAMDDMVLPVSTKSMTCGEHVSLETQDGIMVLHKSYQYSQLTESVTKFSFFF